MLLKPQQWMNPPLQQSVERDEPQTADGKALLHWDYLANLCLK